MSFNNLPTIYNPSKDNLTFNWTSLSKISSSANPLIVLGDFNPTAYTGQQYISLPNGLVIQVFSTAVPVPTGFPSVQTIFFPAGFPTTCFQIIGSPHPSFGSGQDINLGCAATGSSINFSAIVSSTNVGSTSQACTFIAIGY